MRLSIGKFLFTTVAAGSLCLLTNAHPSASQVGPTLAPASPIAGQQGSSRQAIGEIEPNDTVGAAQPLPAGPVRVRADLFRAPFSVDADYYKFTAGAGDHFYGAVITAHSPLGTDSILTLYGTDGTTVIETDDDDGSFSTTASNIAGAVLTSGGTYYLKVEPKVATAAGQIVSYDLYVRVHSGTPLAETEPFNNSAGVYFMPAAGWISGTIDPASDSDNYSFNLNAGDTLVAFLDQDPERDSTDWNAAIAVGTIGDYVLYASDPGTNDPQASKTTVMTVNTAGMYYLYIIDPLGATGGGPDHTYHLSAFVIPADTTRTYTTYAASGGLPGSLTDAGTTDFFLTIPDSRIIDNLRVGLTMTHGAPVDLDVSLISPFGDEVVLFDDLVAASVPPQFYTTFDDEAALPVGVHQANRDGRWAPEQQARLALFRGTQALGTWTLRIRDDTATNTGTLTAWSLSVGELPALPVGPTTIYASDFEADAGGFTHTGTQDEWARGTPVVSPFTACHSGANCWKTDLAGAYNANSSQDLLSPNIDLTAVTGTVVAEWWQKHQMDGAQSDSAWVEIREVSSPSHARRLWEWKGAAMTRDVGAGPTTIQESGGWARIRADISEYNGLIVQLRFHLESDPSGQRGGLGVDDVLVTQQSNYITNGAFELGLSNWSAYATSTDLPAQVPDPNYIVHNNGAGGVMQFYRKPPASSFNQAEVIQTTGVPVAANTALLAGFDAANTSGVRKRLSVLVYDSNFSELEFCTFILDAFAPARRYQMRTHTLNAWGNAAVAFYAHNANAAADTGFYQIDNVSLALNPGGSLVQTECVDPTAPPSGSGGAVTGNLLTSSFGSGPAVAAPWVQFGQVDAHVTGGVLEMKKLSVGVGESFGVVYQALSAEQLPNDQRVAAIFQFGNSSGSRQRVKVVISSRDFTDLSACNFYVPAGQSVTLPTSYYGMRTFATKAAAATPNGDLMISFYPVNPTGEWLQVGDVQLAKTNTITTGTECYEPGSTPSATTAPSAQARAFAGSGPEATALPTSGQSWRSLGPGAGASVLTLAAPLDLRGASSAVLGFTSALSDRSAVGEVQVSLDGVTWNAVLRVPSTSAPTSFTVNLSAFAGELVYVRFVYHAVAPADGSAPDTWQVSDVRIETTPGVVSFARPWKRLPESFPRRNSGT